MGRGRGARRRAAPDRGQHDGRRDEPACGRLAHDGAGHQLKINKAASEDTASILFQSSFSGRAEMGLAGDESFAIKTSSNGDDWIEVCKFDADGRDLRGYGQNVQTGGVSPRVQYNATDTGGSSFAMTRWSNDGNGPGIYLRKSRGGLGSFTAVQSGDTLGTLSFGGSNNSSFTASMDANVRGEAETDFASSINTRLRFLTRSSGASVERMRLSGQAGVHFPTVGTTGNAANAFLDNAATPSNQLLRSTSSLAYKYDVERLDDEVAATFLSEAMPIWYRSMAVADKLDDGSPKSFYSFGAEHLAAIDPRLMTWGYRPEDWEISATEDAEGSETAERVLKRDARKVPDGINDRAVVAILVSVVQRLDERVRALEAQGRSAGPA